MCNLRAGMEALNEARFGPFSNRAKAKDEAPKR